MKITGVTINPKRPTLEFGEADWDDLDPIENAVVLGNGGVQSSPRVYVPRGSDLKTGDKFGHQDKTYFVTSDAEWDFDHPVSQTDMGYVELEISTERGPRDES